MGQGQSSRGHCHQSLLPFYFLLTQGLSLNLMLSSSIRLAGYQVLGSSCLCFPALGLQAHHCLTKWTLRIRFVAIIFLLSPLKRFPFLCMDNKVLIHGGRGLRISSVCTLDSFLWYSLFPLFFPSFLPPLLFLSFSVAVVLQLESNTL